MADRHYESMKSISQSLHFLLKNATMLQETMRNLFSNILLLIEFDL